MVKLNELSSKFCGDTIVIVFLETENASYTLRKNCRYFQENNPDVTNFENMQVLDWRFRDNKLFALVGTQWPRQTPPGYCRMIWDDVIEEHNSFLPNKSPQQTIERLLKRIALTDLEQTFAIVANFKKSDGRISPQNRKRLSENILNPIACVMTHSNPMFYSGLDAVHTAHIDQMVTALYRTKDELVNS